jgi:hypothetical protein
MKRTCPGNNIQGGGTKGHVNLVEKAIFMAWSSTCTHLNFNKLATIFTCEMWGKCFMTKVSAIQ